MEVLHVDLGREMRGGQWQALYLMVGQKTIGLSPTLMAHRTSPLFKEAQQRGVPCLGFSLWGLRKQSAMHKLVHVHDARGHTAAALVAKCPLIVSRRVAFPVGTGFLSRWKYRQAARFLAISEYVAHQLKTAGVPEEKIGVVHDGVPLDPRQPLGDRLLAPWWDDPRKPSALAREAARMAEAEIHFSTDLKKDLPSARALVYLSDMEGLGSGALLAMAHGVPVIASRVGGLPEIVQHGKTGLLVSNDPAEIAAAIIMLMRDKDLARKLGAEAREMVTNGFTLAHMALRTLHQYKKVTKE